MYSTLLFPTSVSLCSQRPCAFFLIQRPCTRVFFCQTSNAIEIKPTMEKGRQSNMKISQHFLETRFWRAAVPNLGAFRLPDLEITFREGTENLVWETASYLYNFVQKTNETEQLGWNFYHIYEWSLSQGSGSPNQRVLKRSSVREITTEVHWSF